MLIGRRIHTSAPSGDGQSRWNIWPAEALSASLWTFRTKRLYSPFTQSFEATLAMNSPTSCSGYGLLSPIRKAEFVYLSLGSNAMVRLFSEDSEEVRSPATCKINRASIAGCHGHFVLTFACANRPL